MNKRKRETPLGKLMAEYNGGQGISDNALARALEMPQPTVTRHANGQVKDAKEAVLEKFAKFFGVTTSFLRGQGGPAAAERVAIYGDLSPMAIDIARHWSALSSDRQEWFRDILFTMRFVEKRFPAMRRGRPKGESYEKLERAFEQDMRQLKLEI